MFVIQTALHILFNILSELACFRKIFAFVFNECSVQCEGEEALMATRSVVFVSKFFNLNL